MSATVTGKSCSCYKTYVSINIFAPEMSKENHPLEPQSYAMHQDRSLIHRLPSEVLATIFIFCLPKATQLRPIKPISTSDAPLLLCNICSFWRRLAISIPQLWNRFSSFRRVSVAPRGEEQTYTDRFIECTHTWLRRAGALPLSIYFSSPPLFHTTEHRLYAAIWECASKWEDATICTQVPFASWSNLGDLPLLHTLRIWGSFDPMGLRGSVPFDSAPNLRILTLPEIITPPMAISGIPWAQLTEFAVYEDVAFFKVIEIIECCPRLESLILEDIGSPEADSGIPTSLRITHSALRSVDFTFIQDCRPLLESLTLPALTTLYMGYYSLEVLENESFSQENRSFFTELIGLFTRSNCELQELGLYNSPFGQRELLQCLEHRSCETLSCLRVENDFYHEIMVDDELLMRLTFAKDESEARLCPGLSDLLLEKCCSESRSPGLLGEMVWSRRFGCTEASRLWSFGLVVRHSLPEADDALLKQAEEDGLRLKVSFPL